VKYSNFTKEYYRNPGTCSFRYVRSQCFEQRLNILPRNIAASWPIENLLQRSLMLSLHLRIVPFFSTILNWKYTTFELSEARTNDSAEHTDLLFRVHLNMTLKLSMSLWN
jgi:hypothetical protein